MLNFENFQYNSASIPTDIVEKQKYLKQLEEHFSEELKNSELAQQYFAKYQPDSVNSFIKTYASRKLHLVQCQRFYSEAYHEKEVSELKFQKEAEKMLDLILQKKLFNLQLRWRAGHLKLEQVDVCYDFEFWGKNSFNCPFAPAITVYEVELMKEYLLRFEEDDEVDDYDLWGYQDYDKLTEKDENGLMQNMPGWYDFYDLRMGTGPLLLLPDNKGSMENFYLSLYREERKTPSPPANTPIPPPYLFSGIEAVYDFARYFEKDRYFLALFKYFKHYEEKDNIQPNYDDLDEAVRFLMTADRPIHLKSHLTWDKAIMQAAKEYKNTKIAESLDFVFDEYRMMKDLGFSKEKSLDEVMEEYKKDFIVQAYRENILKGRVLNGEAEDFNY